MVTHGDFVVDHGSFPAPVQTPNRPAPTRPGSGAVLCRPPEGKGDGLV